MRIPDAEPIHEIATTSGAIFHKTPTFGLAIGATANLVTHHIFHFSKVLRRLFGNYRSLLNGKLCANPIQVFYSTSPNCGLFVLIEKNAFTSCSYCIWSFGLFHWKGLRLRQRLSGSLNARLVLFIVLICVWCRSAKSFGVNLFVFACESDRFRSRNRSVHATRTSS